MLGDLTPANDIHIRYSDDEDTSYKIRRSATKLLSAIIATRPELLVSLFKEVSPVLISRFGDREETVRLEVWSTYGVLLAQTGVYGGLAQTKDGVGVVGNGKRKRDNDEGMDVEETPMALLRSQVPALAKVLLNQLKSTNKTPPGTLQAGFKLLHSILVVLPGSLGGQVTNIISTSKAILSQAPTTSTSTLHHTCLNFLSLFFSTHAPPSFAGSLPSINPVLLKALGEKHPRVASEAFRVFSALLNALKPVKSTGRDWADSVYDEAVSRLSKNDTDAEVRACAEDAIADLWICATSVALSKDRKEWEAICRTAGMTNGAVKVVAKVAREVKISDDWANGCVEWLMVLMRKSGRTGKTDVFNATETLLRRFDKSALCSLMIILIL